MLTANAILTSFSMLEESGIQAPARYATPDGRRAAVRLWSELLYDLDDADLRVAVVAHLRAADRDSSFWPKPGRLLALARASAATPALTADDAWGEVMRMIRQYGTEYAQPLAPGEAWEEDASLPRGCHIGVRRFRLSDDAGTEAAMHRAIRAVGGWRALGMMPADPTDAAPTAASFRRSYDAALRHTESTSIAAMLDDRRAGLRMLPGGAS